MSEIDDKTILDLFAIPSKKQQAFSLLMNKYQKRIYWHIRRIVLCHEDADDVTQTTFIKAWNNLESFKGESSIHTWLYRIATNESITYINKLKRMQLVPLEDSTFLYERLTHDPFFSGDKIQLKLQKAILQLPEKQRIVFTMKYYEDITFDEMAAILETSVGALKASYHHAAKKIEDYLKTQTLV
jgi:RNA polymerase sigma-70 factor (ECF subfamily)